MTQNLEDLKKAMERLSAFAWGRGITHEIGEDADLVQKALNQLTEALDSIRVYGSDTMAGPEAPTPNDRKWYRDGVVEMARRARVALDTVGTSP